MIIVKLIGGLGNQMFQHAFAKKLSLIKRVPVKLDVFWYEDAKNFTKNSLRKYILDNYNTSLRIATREEVVSFLSKRSFVFKVIKKIKRDVLRLDDFSFKEKHFNVSDNAYLEGWWQSEKYFFDIRDILLKEFSLKNGFSGVVKKIETQEIGCNSVSLHIRRGDYVSLKQVNDAFGVLGLEHYDKAIKIIKEKMKEPRFFIFSDDIAWAKENLKIGENAVFVSSPEIKDYEELILMSKCKHNIIANSSFSWWGAWLNQNKNKIVIAPKQWFKTDKFNTKDVVPESWIKI